MTKPKQLIAAVVALTSIAGFSFSQIEVNHVAAATTPGKSSVASNSTSDSGIDPNNPVLPDQSKTVYIDNDQFLQALKKTNPAAYNKLPQSTIQSMQMMIYFDREGHTLKQRAMVLPSISILQL